MHQVLKVQAAKALPSTAKIPKGSQNMPILPWLLRFLASYFAKTSYGLGFRGHEPLGRIQIILAVATSWLCDKFRAE